MRRKKRSLPGKVTGRSVLQNSKNTEQLGTDRIGSSVFIPFLNETGFAGSCF